MKLSFSTKGWHNSSFEEFCNIANDLKFQGIELHNIHNRLFTDKDGAFHDYTAAATVRKLYELKLADLLGYKEFDLEEYIKVVDEALVSHLEVLH